MAFRIKILRNGQLWGIVTHPDSDGAFHQEDFYKNKLDEVVDVMRMRRGWSFILEKDDGYSSDHDADGWQEVESYAHNVFSPP